MKKLNQQSEGEIRTHIESICNSILPDVPFFKNPWYFSSDADFASVIQEEESDNFPVRYLMLSFNGFIDSRKKGCEDNPDVFVSYNLQHFKRSYQTDENVNSHDDVVKELIDLRNEVLDSLDISQGKTILSFQQSGKMIKYQPSDHVANVFGDWFNYTIEVEITS